MSWIKDIVDPKLRLWEEFYRNRWQHDKVVRSTHSVNCTGGCSWNIFVKTASSPGRCRAIDYPKRESSLPLYEPRGCQRGIVFSWYVYSPLRIKYPYLHRVLMDLWESARGKHADPIEAWHPSWRTKTNATPTRRLAERVGFAAPLGSSALKLL